MKRFFTITFIVALAAATFTFAALAAGTVVVTPTNTQGWSTADTRPGGAVNFVEDSTAPSGVGALQLTTNGTNEAKAQYMHSANVPLNEVTELSYYTKQLSGPPTAAPSYQLPVCLGGIAANGDCIGFTNLVYEPYWNGTVVNNTWQKWDVDGGQFWSSSTYSSGACSVVSGAGGPPFYTLAGLEASCPSAVVIGLGVNIGTYNPNYNVYTDLVNLNGTTYDFEPYLIVSNAGQCKKGGWQTLRRADGTPFTNQGDCVSYTNNGK
ncbi:MAG TPA: hypothetical protein VF556_02245 [Pyrinomonadaceae bacterium]|jgi:hypothetical protein